MEQQSLAPFIFTGIFEMLGILLVIVALSVGQVVIVSPIVATSPLWILVGTWLFLRGIEQLSTANGSRRGFSSRRHNCHFRGAMGDWIAVAINVFELGSLPASQNSLRKILVQNRQNPVS